MTKPPVLEGREGAPRSLKNQSFMENSLLRAKMRRRADFGNLAIFN
jgi:hypothetical protein